MIRLGISSLRMIEACRTMFLADNEKLVAEIDRMERNVNEITHDIVRYGTEVGQAGLSSDLSMILNSCISGVGDIEG